MQSRKRHGGIDRDLFIDRSAPIDGNLTVEPRSIGAGHQIVFQFNAPMSAPGTANVLGSNQVPLGSATPFVNPANNLEIIVALAGIADNTRGTVTLSNIAGFASAFPVAMGFLVGDVNNTRAVNSSDISGVKARSVQTLNASNFMFDVNVNGSITSSDISAVKARSGVMLAP